MKLVLVRKWLNGEALIGQLFVDGQYECVILENATKRIPLGTYPVVISYSPRFGRELPLLCNVPDREGIRLHPANYPSQLEGCLAPGTTHNQDSVSNSRFAFGEVYQKICKVVQGITITIQGEPT